MHQLLQIWLVSTICYFGVWGLVSAINFRFLVPLHVAFVFLGKFLLFAKLSEAFFVK